MKSVYDSFLALKTRKKLAFSEQKTDSTNAYKREDFLTPGMVAKKFKISTEQALGTMKKLAFKRAYFALNGHKSPIVTRLGSHNSKQVFLHPMAIQAFQDILDKQKD